MYTILTSAMLRLYVRQLTNAVCSESLQWCMYNCRTQLALRAPGRRIPISAEKIHGSAPSPHPIHLMSGQFTAMASVHLSNSLKALIASPQAQGGVVPAPSKAAATALFEGLASSAQQHGLGAPAWLTLGVRAECQKDHRPRCLLTSEHRRPDQSAALVTLNSPDTLCALYSFARDRCDANERATRSVEYAGVRPRR